MKQVKEILLNNIKQLFFCFLLLFISNCKQSIKEQKPDINKQSKTRTYAKEISNQIDFLDTKYQKNGLTILDNLTGDLYPSYSYFDKSIGSFSVNYIGKTYNAQYFWDIHNPSGYFLKYKNPEDIEAQNSKNIKNAFNESDYYIIADFLPSKYIKNIDEESGEFDISENAKTDIYIYEKNKWIKLGEFEKQKIPERNFQYYIKLIQSYKKDIIPKQFQGKFSIYTETEATTSGIASITYHFDINENTSNLIKNTYHEPINCEGEYIGKTQDNILKLFYVGDDMNCVSIEPKFNIKFDKNKYYIKGVGEEETNQWFLMNNNGGNTIK